MNTKTSTQKSSDIDSLANEMVETDLVSPEIRQQAVLESFLERAMASVNLNQSMAQMANSDFLDLWSSNSGNLRRFDPVQQQLNEDFLSSVRSRFCSQLINLHAVMEEYFATLNSPELVLTGRQAFTQFVGQMEELFGRGTRTLLTSEIAFNCLGSGIVENGVIKKELASIVANSKNRIGSEFYQADTIQSIFEIHAGNLDRVLEGAAENLVVKFDDGLEQLSNCLDIFYQYGCELAGSPIVTSHTRLELIRTSAIQAGIQAALTDILQEGVDLKNATKEELEEIDDKVNAVSAGLLSIIKDVDSMLVKYSIDAWESPTRELDSFQRSQLNQFSAWFKQIDLLDDFQEVAAENEKMEKSFGEYIKFIENRIRQTKAFISWVKDSELGKVTLEG